MKFKVQFFKGTRAQYDSISPDKYTFYFITDEDKVYLGDVQLTNTGFADLQNQIYDLARRLNDIQQNMVKVFTVTDQNKERIQSKISTKDTFYVYVDSDGHGSPDIKIGDGTSYVSSLPFLSQGTSLRFESLEALLYEHMADNNRHIRELEYVDSEDRQLYGNITERDKWDNRVAAYTTRINELDKEEYISSNQIAFSQEDQKDFCLYLDNSNIIIKDNIPKRIQLKN